MLFIKILLTLNYYLIFIWTMIFDFKINDIYIFLHAINTSQDEEPFEWWFDFTNKIWEENPEIYFFLSGSPEYSLYLTDLRELYKKPFKKLEKLKETETYKRLIKETETYKNFVENQWKLNEKFVLKQLLSFWIKINIPYKIKVNISHPKLKNGLAYDNKAIVWWHSEDYKNYSTVYLIHELLHILTKNDNSDITHAIIELLADNEMRIRLNSKGKYFEYKWHKHLIETEKNLYEDWINFIKWKDLNLFNYIKKTKKEVIQ